MAESFLLPCRRLWWRVGLVWFSVAPVRWAGRKKALETTFSVQERTVVVTTPSRVPVNLGKGETMRGGCPF